MRAITTSIQSIAFSTTPSIHILSPGRQSLKMNNLPTELLEEILHACLTDSPSTFRNLSATCRKFYDLSQRKPFLHRLAMSDEYYPARYLYRLSHLKIGSCFNDRASLEVALERLEKETELTTEDVEAVIVIYRKLYDIDTSIYAGCRNKWVKSLPHGYTRSNSGAKRCFPETFAFDLTLFRISHDLETSKFLRDWIWSDACPIATESKEGVISDDRNRATFKEMVARTRSFKRVMETISNDRRKGDFEYWLLTCFFYNASLDEIWEFLCGEDEERKLRLLDGYGLVENEEYVFDDK